MVDEKALSIQKIRTEVELELSNPENLKTLVATTFKGLKPELVPQAMIEGYIRGFDFKDFLNKNIYAIPFKDAYSLVTSIDYSRKIGQQSGIIGKDAPVFEIGENGAVVACTVTVHKKHSDGEKGDYTATVYFAEYKSDKPIWVSKPRTMLAKVAEMHALRMACPAELAQSYVEEEFDKGESSEERSSNGFTIDDLNRYKEKIEAAESTVELTKIWSAFPGEMKTNLTVDKDKKKKELAAAGK